MQYTINNLNAFIDELIKDSLVYAPKRVNKTTTLYGSIASFEEYDNEALLTNTTAKGIIYSQSEKMFDIKKGTDGASLTEEDVAKKAIIFGCRPCDARGFSLLDKLFNWDGYKDEYYFRKRNNTTVISISCGQPETTCFCTSFKDGGPDSSTGSDLLLTLIKDKYLVDVITEKGKGIIENYSSYFHQIADGDIAEKNESRMPKKIDIELIKQRLASSFESPYWNTVHLPCLKCGVCTFVCPTCYCFDITEKEFDHTCGERNRTWDTCMSEIFTRMAGGANPRLDPKRRFRQRIMHKFKYHVDNFNEELCTGCGRCIKYCPAGVDVRKVLEEVK
ncbi:MAG: 4Fe-4S dicluster domain-containing protein [Candidatus Desantisbacteria bacterium]